MSSSMHRTGLRYAVRTFAILYYPAFGPMLYDLFTKGLRARSAYFFVFLAFSIAALQIGWKEPGKWVKAWYLANAVFLGSFVTAIWVRPDIETLFSMYPWEKELHFGFLCLVFLGFALDRILEPRHASTEPVDEFPPVKLP